MPSYTIDASNNTEPLDTRYVADFPAELRAMKSRMNQAINDQGQLSGGLKTDVPPARRTGVCPPSRQWTGSKRT